MNVISDLVTRICNVLVASDEGAHASGSAILGDWPGWAWAAFVIFILAMLTLDLGVLHRKAHEVKVKEALIWCAVWITLALSFNLLLLITKGKQIALEFLTGYLIEYSLSVDNIFVFILIFTYFQVPAKYQHRVLFWGILGALVMRAIMIFAGVALINAFHWVIFFFGALLIFSGLKMAFSKGKKMEPEKNPIIKLVKSYVPVTSEYHGQRFFVNIHGKKFATPLFVILILIEVTDLVFAVDSIPAILGITRNAFIVFTSNVFAILGLRSLYFALAGVMGMFAYLHYGLSAVLVFVGIKMIVNGIMEEGFIPIELSLAVVVLLLAGSVIASIIARKRSGGGEEVHGSH